MNSWSYTALCRRGEVSPQSIVQNSVRIARAYGYLPVSRFTSQVEIWGSPVELADKPYLDESDYHRTFPSVDEVIAYLSTNGGLLTLSKGEVEISISFDHPDPQVVARTNELRRNCASLFIETSLGVENSYYRSDTSGRERTASDTKGIFTELCTWLDSPHGYSLDENAGDQLIYEKFLYDKTDLCDCGQTNERPRVLLWMQYFSREYARKVNVPQMRRLGGRTEELSKGLLVRFFDHPWEVDLRELARINKEWQQDA